MSAKHTPGPWHRDGAINGLPWTVHATVHPVEPWDGFIAECYGKDDAERVSSARLIAAAPELLEALKKLVKAFELPPTCEAADATITAMMNAQAAIAKAEGRT